MRSTDTTPPPEAVERKKKVKLSFASGVIGIGISTSSFFYGLYLENVVILFGSFICVMISGGVIPFAEAKSLIPWARNGNGNGNGNMYNRRKDGNCD